MDGSVFFGNFVREVEEEMREVEPVGGALVLGTVLLLAAGGVLAEEQMHPAPAVSAELERLKQLAGRWEGTSQETDKEAQPAVVEYKVTSGGSAVVETLFPGTPHEMVSVYHDEHGKIAMTHYCMLGNQPNLRLTQASDKELDFSLADGSGIDLATEQHMHALKLMQGDTDHLSQVWTCYEGGKPSHNVTISLSRLR